MPIRSYWRLMRSLGYDRIEALIETAFAVLWGKAR